MGSTVLEAATTPSCRALRQACSLSPVNCASQKFLTMSCDLVNLPVVTQLTISTGVLPPYMGSIMGCWIEAAPSELASSPQDSSKWASGMCQVAAAAVSSSSLPRWIEVATFESATGNCKSAGAE